MSYNLRARIAAVQAQHHHWDYAGALTCACGETFGLGVEAGWEAAVAGWAVHVADAAIRELEAGYVLVPKNVMLVQWADEAFKDQPEGKFKHERITEWTADD